jgi:hypothetical protein
MANIEVVIEGDGAERAAEALLIDSDIDGSLETVDNSDKKDPLTTAAAIVAIAAGSVGTLNGLITLSEKIYQWYKKIKQSDSNQLDKNQKIEKVLLIGSKGQRLLLEGATPEQIRRVLEP